MFRRYLLLLVILNVLSSLFFVAAVICYVLGGEMLLAGILSIAALASIGSVVFNVLTLRRTQE